MLERGKRGQVSIFIIVALLIAAAIGGYFVVKGQLGKGAENQEFSQVYSYYSSCIEQYAKTGINIASVRGGRIDSGEYNPGSDYAPFGNQLNVGGVGVPYWFTVQGNGVLKEDVPTKSEIEKELEGYIENRIKDCDFDTYRNQGLEISLESPKATVNVLGDGVTVNVDSKLSVASENSSSSKTSFDVQIQSNFGNMFAEAKKLYAEEQSSLFLENYSYDVLRLYAPVDGVEIQCAPKTWIAREVLSDLKTGLQSNLESLKFDGAKNDYFSVNFNSQNGIQALYSSAWPSRFEIYGNKGELLQADPVGNQQGLQTMGFCYVPYHFVYDMFFPVVFRISSSDNEIFQFPVVVIIDKNVPRQGTQYTLESEDDVEQDLCQFATNDLEVSVRSSEGGSVSGAKVNYKCFDQSCEVGTTNSNGKLVGKVPACINGYLQIESEGYQQKSSLFSSNNASETEVFLDKNYQVELNLLVDGKESQGQTFISFAGDNGIVQGVIPDSAEVKLTSGFYNVSVYQYGNASIRIPSSTTRQCSDVPSSGIAGFLGATKEQCYDITLPETIIDRALTAGGTGEIYLPQELLEKGELTIMVDSLPKPTGIDSLESNYALFETQGVDVSYE